MPRKLQFAFLGCHCLYLASVTHVNQLNYPYKPAEVRDHGLPSRFVDSFRNFSRDKYVSNIRGHDCYAFLAHWTNEKKGTTEETKELFNEMVTLRTRLQKCEKDGDSFDDADVLLSLGPKAGSYFAHMRCLDCSHWTGLPEDLEFSLQRNRHDVFDIAINADGGWVIQRNEGRSYEMGGILPDQLCDALMEGKRREKIIKNLYLNHQNSREYLLVFTDGTAYVSLHRGFESKIRELVEEVFDSKLPRAVSWMSSKPEKINWNFTPSCHCDLNEQRRINAAYYNQRGRFHLRLMNAKQALAYMREAHNLNVLSNPTEQLRNSNYFKDYCVSLKAVVGRDQPVEDHVLHYNPSNELSNEYALIMNQMRENGIMEREVQARWREILMEERHNQWQNQTPLLC